MQAAWWEEVAVLAATRGLETDAVYLARLDPRAVEAVNARVAALLERGAHEARTLYVLGDDAALERARAGMDPARDLLGRFNDRWVLAPGWRVQPAAVAATWAVAQTPLIRTVRPWPMEASPTRKASILQPVSWPMVEKVVTVVAARAVRFPPYSMGAVADPVAVAAVGAVADRARAT
jgi:hypothetical protein